MIAGAEIIESIDHRPRRVERNGDKEFVQFLSIAKGSGGEVRAQLYVSLDQGYLTSEKFEILREQALQVNRKLAALMRYLSRSELRGSKYRPVA